MIYLDFETYSAVDLKKTGLSRYAEDPSTEVLCLAWAIDDGEPKLWIAGQPAPHELFSCAAINTLSSFNAQFEMAIWQKVCVERMGWPPLPNDRWMDTQADCLALGLPADLDRYAMALGLPGKDPIGKRLITKLCKPCKPTKKHDSIRWCKEDAHQDYLNLYAYCLQDVRVERSTAKRLPYRVTAPGHMEREVWLETVRQNQEGIPIDTVTLDRMNQLIGEKIERLTSEMQRLTGGKIQTVKQ
jgi:DNA polymerase